MQQLLKLYFARQLVAEAGMKCRCGRDLCTFLIASSPPEAITARRSLTIPFTRCFKTRNFLNYFLLPPKRVGATKT